MRVAALVSGGKDSALALHRALTKELEVKFLVTMVPQRNDSWMFHFPNVHLTHLFAEAAGIPLVEGETAGIKEEELKDLKKTLIPLDIDGVVSGSITSQYQKQRIEAVCHEIGIKSITPLWNEDPKKLLQELVELKFKVIITGVFAYGFDERWLGRLIDAETIKALLELSYKHQISLAGEGGEYETLVLDAPFFDRRIALTAAKKIWENGSGWLRVKKAHLLEK
ncbi:MAG: TIGR00289 family protein [Candidatus Bathyarchaeota archaeon]|nr:MAG: TIGR00289 family protein [Candidatus Bathyarchaeota archaeon]